MTDLFTELKEACRREPEASDEEVIARGGSTWFRGRPTHAEEGTIALGMGRDAAVVISERDVRAVTKEGESYNVEVSSEANVLLRVEKSIKATVQPDCDCHEDSASPKRTRSRKSDIDLEIGPIMVCELLCTDVVIDNGRQSVVVEICIPVNCYIEGRSSR
jgi:hypothetical protein